MALVVFASAVVVGTMIARYTNLYVGLCAFFIALGAGLYVTAG